MRGITDIHHVIYGHPDLDAAEGFYRDFGMITAERDAERLYLRGTGPASYVYVAQRAPRPGFIAVALAVESLAALRRCAALPGAAGPEPLDGFGGGQRVSLRDPDGYCIDLVHGITPAAALPMRPALTINTASDKPRRGAVQRPQRAAAQILRLGHVALFVSNFARSREWYERTLGMLTSDVLYKGSPDKPVGGFLRCDRGEDWVDHHTIALFESPTVHIHHSSYEVQDLDMLMMGHEWLRAQNRKPLWGVGRHVLGSQIFDYWWDTAGHLVEHFSDGDLLQARQQTGFTPNTADALCQWGPPLPKAFFA
ncbi:MAG: 2,4,5-trihydroxytoluene oxygenase [Candidatus Binataceae bacterium]